MTFKSNLTIKFNPSNTSVWWGSSAICFIHESHNQKTFNQNVIALLQGLCWVLNVEHKDIYWTCNDELRREQYEEVKKAFYEKSL